MENFKEKVLANIIKSFFEIQFKEKHFGGVFFQLRNNLLSRSHAVQDNLDFDEALWEGLTKESMQFVILFTKTLEMILSEQLASLIGLKSPIASGLFFFGIRVNHK